MNTMYRRPSKKQQLIRRIIVLIISVISVGVIVTGTILFILGYRLDGSNGRLEQGALVQFDSRPGGANVTIDGGFINAQTATKRSLIAGEHTFKIDREGYNPWERTLKLDAGTLTWLDYIRLVPKELDKQTVRSYESVVDVEAAPDFQTIIVQEKRDTPLFEIIDIRSQDVKSRRVTLPQSLYSEPVTEGVTHEFTLDEWDEDGRYVLLQHRFRDTTEWLVIDTENIEASVNVSRLLSLSLTDLQFAGTSGNILYGLSDGVVRKLDLGSATISRGLVSSVSSFTMYESNMFTYVGRDAAVADTQVVGIYRDGDREPHILRSIKGLDTKIFIDTTRYYNDAYIAIAEGAEVTILKGTYPTAGQSADESMDILRTFEVVSPVDQFTFSVEGDYLLVRSGTGFWTYEVAYDRLNQSAMVTTGEARPLEWLDDAHLSAVYEGHLSMRDFDGTNVHVIMPMEPGFDATLSQNGRYIYGVNNTDGTYRLERVTMILE